MQIHSAVKHIKRRRLSFDDDDANNRQHCRGNIICKCNLFLKKTSSGRERRHEVVFIEGNILYKLCSYHIEFRRLIIILRLYRIAKKKKKKIRRQRNNGSNFNTRDPVRIGKKKGEKNVFRID